MILKNNGQVIIDPYPIDPVTAEYLNQFWKLPSQEEYLKEHEAILTTDR